MKFNKFLKATALATAVFLPWGICSLKPNEGEIWAWGSGRNGELGIGQQTNSPLPKAIKNMKFVDLSAGKSISAAITADGKLYTWGKNRNGLLGHQPPNLNVLLPREIDSLKVKQVSCGYQQICVVTEDNEAYIWGVHLPKTKFRSVGINEVERKVTTDGKPMKIDVPNVKQVSCAGDYTTLVNNQGRVFVMGASKLKGKDGTVAKLSTDIIQLEFDSPIVRIQSGPNFSMALNDQGKVYVWGNNTFGQLGIGSLNNIHEPKMMEAFMRQKIVDISCGENYSGAVTANGDVYTWGFGNEGQLGHGDKHDQFSPRKIQLNEKVQKISCGGAHSALLTQSGKLLMMGRGREGQMGREHMDEGSSGYNLQPKLVEQLPAKKIAKVSCGVSHTLVLMEAL